MWPRSYGLVPEEACHDGAVPDGLDWAGHE